MELIVNTSLRTLTGFFVLLLLVRLLGKKQLNDMSFFTYITGIALGNIAGDMVVHKDIKLIEGIFALVIWVLLTFTIEHLTLMSPKIRVILDGEPTLIIKNGKILEKAMASSRLNMDDLTMLLRNKNIFSVKEVDYAVLEPNGKLSVLKNVEMEPVTKKDLNMSAAKRMYMPAELVVDGKIVNRNLTELNLNEEWLLQKLKMSGITSIKDVFFAELQSDGTVYFDKKDKPS